VEGTINEVLFQVEIELELLNESKLNLFQEAEGGKCSKMKSMNNNEELEKFGRGKVFLNPKHCSRGMIDQQRCNSSTTEADLQLGIS
jgi:hypothetical protein